MKYLNIYACCIPVRGFKRGLICDLQKNNFHFVPNTLIDIIELMNKHTYNEILNMVGFDQKETLDEYIKILIERDIIHLVDNLEEKNCFDSLNLEWQEPLKLSSSILDIGINYKYNILNIISQLDDIGCNNIQIRFWDFPSVDYIQNINNKIITTKIKSIELVLPYSMEYINLLKFSDNIDNRIKHLTFYNSSVEKFENINGVDISFIKTRNLSTKHCGFIDTKYFSPTLSTFTESLSYNSCLNRKISVDENGLIKNCPSMEMNFGNIDEVKLEKVLMNESFLAIWGINKDQIEVCKSCEFRYICTDCRAYLEDPNNQLSKPLKCGYNPETCTWDEWSSNPLKKKSIDFYNL